MSKIRNYFSYNIIGEVMSMFGKVLRELRTKKKLSQKDIAKALYLSNSSISHYENNRCLPSRETIEAIARFFNVSTDYLLGSTHICDLEELLQQEYHGDISVYDFLVKCLNIPVKDRHTLLTIVDALETKK